MTKFTYSIDDYNAPQYNGVSLYLDPEESPPHIWTVGQIGNGGTPMNVWHRRAISLPINVQPTTVGESLQTYLESIEDDLIELIGCYQGSEWDGNNYVGQWSEDEHDILDRIEANAHDAPIATYWDAGDWLQNTPTDEVRADCERAGSPHNLVAEYLASADVDCYLDADDLEEEIERRLEVQP